MLVRAGRAVGFVRPAIGGYLCVLADGAQAAGRFYDSVAAIDSMAKTTILVTLPLLAMFVMSSCGRDSASSTSSGSFQLMEAAIDDVHAAYRSGQLTARQLVQRYLDRIAAYDQQGPDLNCIITLEPEALA